MERRCERLGDGLARVAAFALGVAVAGCATPPPVAEVRLVNRAFDDLHAASQPLLDDLALAEREQGRRAAEIRARRTAEGKPAAGTRCPGIQLIGAGREGVQDGFCPPDSPYYAELADPPATKAFRRSLAAVGDYTRLLLLLAEGRNVDQAKAELQSVAGNLGSALEIAGAGGASVALTGALKALDPLIDLAARDANAAELERVVRAEAPKVERLVAALRDGAPELFRTLTEAPLRRFTEEGLKSEEIARVEARRIEGYRVVVSSYVLLLDQYREVLRDLVAAYDRGGGRPTLTHVAERSAELSARADAWRRSLAGLRTGLR